MSKNCAIIIQFVLLTTFYRSGAQKSNVYKRDAFVTSWRFHNRAWQPQRHDRLPETSGTLWIHRGALTNQRCSLATGCGIKYHGCWCPGDVRSQGISSHGIDYVEYVGPGLTWGRILSTCVISMWSNDIKCKYMLMFPLQNLAHEELKT